MSTKGLLPFLASLAFTVHYVCHCGWRRVSDKAEPVGLARPWRHLCTERLRRRVDGRVACSGFHALRTGAVSEAKLSVSVVFDPKLPQVVPSSKFMQCPFPFSREISGTEWRTITKL